MMMDGSFASRLGSIERHVGSKAELARRAGLSASGLQQYFTGGEPTLSKLIALAKAGNVSVEWLATGSGRGPEPENVREWREGHEVLGYCNHMVKEVGAAAGWKLGANEEHHLLMALHSFVEGELQKDKPCPDLGAAVALLRAEFGRLRGTPAPGTAESA